MVRYYRRTSNLVFNANKDNHFHYTHRTDQQLKSTNNNKNSSTTDFLWSTRHWFDIRLRYIGIVNVLNTINSIGKALRPGEWQNHNSSTIWNQKEKPSLTSSCMCFLFETNRAPPWKINMYYTFASSTQNIRLGNQLNLGNWIDATQRASINETLTWHIRSIIQITYRHFLYMYFSYHFILFLNLFYFDTFDRLNLLWKSLFSVALRCPLI